MYVCREVKFLYKNLKQKFNDNQRNLRALLKKKDSFKKAIDLCLTQHTLVHNLKPIDLDKTLFDLVTDSYDVDILKNLQDKDKRTVAFHIWHSTRIEDITVNILVNDSKQVINTNNWQEKLSTGFTTTGNEFTEQQILKLSNELNIVELLNYRLEVANNTQKMLKELKPNDLKRTFSDTQKNRILKENAVENHKDSIWLIDFWGRKNVAGILLMPVTRHHLLHINASIRLLIRAKKFKA